MNLAEQILQNAKDDREFTRIINEHYTIHEKLFLIELLWRITYADGMADDREEQLMEKVAKQLDVPKKEILKALKRSIP